VNQLDDVIDRYQFVSWPLCCTLVWHVHPRLPGEVCESSIYRVPPLGLSCQSTAGLGQPPAWLTKESLPVLSVSTMALHGFASVCSPLASAAPREIITAHRASTEISDHHSYIKILYMRSTWEPAKPPCTKNSAFSPTRERNFRKTRHSEDQFARVMRLFRVDGSSKAWMTFFTEKDEHLWRI
jgi:hypothetical protein